MEWLKTRASRNDTPLLLRGYRSAVTLLYPHRCAVCGDIVTKEGAICDGCRYEVKYVVSPFCMKCGKALEDEEQELCIDCKKKHHEFVRGVAAFDYSRKMKESMYRFKYANCREYAKFYAASIARLKGHIILSFKPDALIPVPLHKKRLRQRGYNQAALVADELGKILGIKVDDEALFRAGATKPQKELDDAQRNANVKDAFCTRGTLPYQSVILVDDIYTTGATVDACASILKKAGVSNVYFAAVCIGRGF